MYNIIDRIISEYDMFVFDLDDTLVKTEHLHYDAWMHVLTKYMGPTFSLSYYEFVYKMHSNNGFPVVKYLKDDLNLSNYQDLITEKNKYFLELIENDPKKITLCNGVENFLTQITRLGKPFVIVTNNVKRNVDHICSMFPVLNQAKKIYTREMMTRKKPDPECYLRVLDDFPNKKMIGFEDSLTGIHSIVCSKNIDVVFINNKDYPYYQYILETYQDIKYTCENFNEIYSHNIIPQVVTINL